MTTTPAGWTAFAAASLLCMAVMGGWVSFPCDRCSVGWQIPHFRPPLTIERLLDMYSGRACVNAWSRGGLDREDGGLGSAIALQWRDPRWLLMEIDVGLLNRVDSFGRTAMHWLALRMRSEERDDLIADLARRGASLDVRDKDGLTPHDWRRLADAGRVRPAIRPCNHCGGTRF